MRKIIALSWLLVLAAFTPMVSMADSWGLPGTTVTASADGKWRLTVTPRQVSSQLAYFEDKVAKKSNAGAPAGESQTSASGRMEHRVNGKWESVWEGPLVNEVSPVDVLAAPGGAAVTFDNWHSMGYGDDVVVIYNAKGHPVRAFGLKDFLPKDFIEALPRSVSSMDWRGEPTLSGDGRQLIIPVIIPTTQRDDENYRTPPPRYINVRFDMETGQPIEDSSSAWTDAVASAESRKAQLDRQEALQRRRFIEPISAPNSAGELAWYEYLVEAFFRLDPDSEGTYPSRQVIRVPGSENAKMSIKWLWEALTEHPASKKVIMIASPSQDVLASVLSAEGAKLRAGTLAQARVYVVADKAHAEKVRAALAHAGGTLIILDPNEPIPQRKERLERYLNREKD